MTTPHEHTQPKPPPIVLGVSGIESQVVVNTQTPDGRSNIDWQRLIGLPPFQLFMASQLAFEPDQYDPTVRYFLHQQSQNLGGLQKLFDEYCCWHKQKNQWPKETPLGYLLEE